MTERNNYEPPRSGFKAPPPSREPGPIWKAVLLGVATDIGGTMIVGAILGLIAAVVLGLQGQSSEQINETLKSIDLTSPLGLISGALGLGMSVLGGYVCAYTANHQSYLPLGIMSAISVGFGALSSSDSYEWSTLLLLNLLGLAAIFLGGWLYNRKLPPGK